MAHRALIDTGALLAVANPRDQYHGRAVEAGRRFLAGGGRWLGTSLVLAEFHAHILRWRGPRDARELVRAVLADPAYEWVDVSVELIEVAVSGWLERYHDQRFSLTAAVSFEVMRRERVATAFAFDEDFRTAGYALLA
ncbi:MAG: type II toxin-antitoxin system VapC family toxin [Gemmatimonadales bacterium]